MEPQRLYRSKTDSMIGGVCGGLPHSIDLRDLNDLRRRRCVDLFDLVDRDSAGRPISGHAPTDDSRQCAGPGRSSA